MNVEVQPLDPHDDWQWDDFYRVYVGAELFGRPFADAPSADTFRVSFTRAAIDFATTGLVARMAGAAVGVAVVRFRFSTT